jgi:hypothetical protein
LNLFAAFDTRTGKIYAHTAERKRQKEFIEFLEQLEREIPATLRADRRVPPLERGRDVSAVPRILLGNRLTLLEGGAGQF